MTRGAVGLPKILRVESEMKKLRKPFSARIMKAGRFDEIGAIDGGDLLKESIA